MACYVSSFSGVKRATALDNQYRVRRFFDATPRCDDLRTGAERFSAKPGGGNDASEEQSVSSERFQSSLSDVIAMLENEEQRRALLDSLRELQLATEAGEEDKIVHQGLLGALADTLTDIGEQAQAGDSPVDEWSRQLVQGAADLRALNDGADQGRRYAQWLKAPSLVLFGGRCWSL